MATAWKNVRVFISSTFLDMQAERDHLVRFVFPRLRETLLRRRIHLVDVDLRWGVTSDQDALTVCREVVDECRPRFLCLLGGRYGWVPPGKDRSITADEVYYGVLDRSADSRGFAWFYFRDDDATAAMEERKPGEFREAPGSESARRLAELKEAIAAVGLNPLVYSAEWDRESRRLFRLEEFGQRVHDDLLGSIDAEFGAPTALPFDEFAGERAAMEAFVLERSEGYVPGSREAVVEDLVSRATEPGRGGQLCLWGAPGTGKTALLAHLARHPSFDAPAPLLFIPHFVGATPGSSDLRHLLRRLCQEIFLGCELARDREEELSRVPDTPLDAALEARRAIREKYRIPDDREGLRAQFDRFIGMGAAKRRLVILIDALDQLDRTWDSDGISWLPGKLPPDAIIIHSVVAGPLRDALRAQLPQLEEVELGPLTSADGGAIIERYCARYQKRLEPEQQAALLAKPDARTPLYLVAALEELRTLGTHAEISGQIARLPPTTQSLFEWILIRLAEDEGFRNAAGERIGAALVSGFGASLAASRHGLSERELADLLDEGDRLGNVASLLRLLRPYLVRRGELLGFYHGQLRTAAEDLWLSGEGDRRIVHGRLAAYFETNADPEGDHSFRGPDARPLSELPHHLAVSDPEKLGRLLLEFSWLEANTEQSLVPDLIGSCELALSVLDAAAPGRRALRAVEGALRLSQRVLGEDPTQLAGQLIGRLGGTGDGDVRRLLASASPRHGRPWLRPRNANLAPPGTPRLRSMREGATRIYALALTHGPTRVVSAAEDSLDVWEPSSGRLLRSLPGGTVAANGLAWVPGSDEVLLAPGINSLELWDVERGHRIAVLANGRTDDGYIHMNPVGEPVAVSGDGRLGASVLDRMSLRLWDLESRGERWVLREHTDDIQAIAFTRSGWILTGSRDRTVRRWEPDTGRVVGVFSGHEGDVRCVAATPDERYAISGSSDGTVRGWDCERGAEAFVLQGHTGDVNAIAVSPDGRRLVSGSNDGTLRVWDLANRVEVGRLLGHSSWVSAVGIDPEGPTSVSGSSKGTLTVWDLRADVIMTARAGHEGPVEAVAVLADPLRGVSGGADGTLRVWDLATGDQVCSLPGHPSPVEALAAIPGRPWIVSGAKDGTLKIWDLAIGGEVVSWAGPPGPILKVMVDRAGRQAITITRVARQRYQFCWWDLERRVGVQALEINCDFLRAAAATPDGESLLVSCHFVEDSSGGLVQLQDSGRLGIKRRKIETLSVLSLDGRIREITRGETAVSELLILPGEEQAIGVTRDELLVVDLLGGESVPLTRLPNSASCLAIEPTRELAAVGDWTGVLEVLDLRTGERRAAFTGDGPASCCAFGPGGGTLLVGEASGSVHVVGIEWPG